MAGVRNVVRLNARLSGVQKSVPHMRQMVASCVSGSSARARTAVKAMHSTAARWNQAAVAASGRTSGFEDNLRAQLQGIHDAGTFKKERVITSPMNSEITVQGRSGSVLNFCANNYLGLSDHPKILDAAKKHVDTHGNGLSSVRFICGTQDIHKELERVIAKFHKQEDSILYPSCFDANAGIFECLLTKDDAIISDALNHASIIDGVRLCKAQRYRFNHLDMSDLESKLQEAGANGARFKLIAVDGVFSMDGDVAPLDKICSLADKYDARVFIDECHATGFFGPTGKGTAEHFGVEERIDIVNSTLGKAMGGATGGYTAASADIVTMLRQKSRPYLFSNSVAPSVVGASLAAYDIINSSTELQDKLKSHVSHFRSSLTKAGFTVTGDPSHPICPVLLGDAKLASEMADEMLQQGIYVIGFSYPVVPVGQARIRVQLSAAHSKEHVNKCIEAFIAVGKKFGVIQ